MYRSGETPRVRRLPYGASVRNEWGVIIYRRDGQWCTTAPIEGTEDQVPFRVGRLNGKIITLDGVYGLRGNYPIVEFAHTHPLDPLQDYAKFSGGEAGDIWWAEHLRIPFSMRCGDRVALYDPAKAKLRRHPITQKILGHPGRTLFWIGRKEKASHRRHV